MIKKPFLSHYSYWLITGLLSGITFLLLNGHVEINYHTQLDQQTQQSDVDEYLKTASFSSAIQKAAPAVVSITTFINELTPSDNSQQHNNHAILQKDFSPLPMQLSQIPKESGSGVIINSNGYILTNYHVIKNANLIRVNLNDGRQASGELIGSDPDTDLAILRISLNNITSIKIGNSDQLKIGDIVLAIGDPFSIGQAVTQGIISATGRTEVSNNTYEDFLQTDAAINPGNSGGALINTSGEIIGINSNIYSNSGNYQGISFAIPINLAIQVYNDILTHGYVVRGWLGVGGQALNPNVLKSIDIALTHGILISDVDIGGPGQIAGIQPGDIITRINNTEIYTITDIINLVAAGKPGDSFRLEGLRQREAFSLTATLGQRPLIKKTD